VPIGVEVEPAPSQVALESPSRAAVTAQSVTGAKTDVEPIAVVPTWEGSHELLAVPSTATTTLQAFTGTTPSAGALWLALLVGRSLTSGYPASGMHIPFAEPSTSTTAPHAVTGTKTSAACPRWVAGSACCGQLDELSPSISAITSQTVTGTSASTTPVWVLEPRVPVLSQSLDVFPTRPTFTEQMLTGASALTAPFCDVDADDWPLASPSAAAASFSKPTALFCAVMGTLASARPPGSFSPTDVVEQLLLASPATPPESEQALIGASALATGDDCPVVFVPVVEPWLGSGVSPSSFDTTVMGAATEAGTDGSGLGAGGGGGVVVCATAAAVAFCTACSVLGRSADDAALAGVAPTTAPTDSTSPHVSTPMEVGLFRLMVLLLLSGDGHPAGAACVIPAKRASSQVRAKGAREL
jgi:hypothetical protein